MISGIAAKALSFFTCLFLLCTPATPLDQTFGTANTKIRQEINITTAYQYAPSGSYATSSAIVMVHDANYTGATAYFEVVASTTGATNATVSLVNATSSATVKSITIDQGNTYTRYRSTSFALASTTEYKVVLGNEAIGKGILASRIIILQDSGSGDLTNTETQIEIGAQETFTGTATSTFTEPKYWTYSASKWDSSPTFYAEVTYKVINGVASTTNVTAAGTYTINLPGGTASTSIALRGGGGAGDGTTDNSVGNYGGGGGGAYAQSTLLATTSSHTLVIGATAVGEATTALAPNGATTTWDVAVVKADGGGGGVTTSGGRKGLASLSVGQTTFDGGAGAVGGGGEGAGSTANGGSASGNTGGSGTDGGDGANGSAVEADGTAGTAPGGGGSGANIADATNHTGGNGAVGSSTIINYIASSTISLEEDDGTFANWTATTSMVTFSSVGGGTETRVRSSAFIPRDGRHYRIAIRKPDTRTSVAIYNAKIVVVQAPQITIAFDVGNNGAEAGAGVANASWTHTTTGSNRILIVSVQNLSNVDDLSTPTYAGENLTLLRKEHNTSTNKWDYIWYKIAPALGSNTVSVTRTNTTSLMDTASVSYIGVNQTTPINHSNFNTGTGSTFTQTLTATTTGAWTILFAENNTTVTTASTNVTQRAADGAGVRRGIIGDSNGPQEGAFSMSVTGNASSGWTGIIFTLNPATSGLITLLEPQYLLAPFKLPAGTALQNFLTLFDPAEWSTTNGYMLAVDAADNSTSVVTLKDSTGATTYATVTSPDNHATSTLTCIPSSSTAWDTAATTNNNDVYGVRVLVQVGGSSPSICGAAAPITPSRVQINAATYFGAGTGI